MRWNRASLSEVPKLILTLKFATFGTIFQLRTTLPFDRLIAKIFNLVVFTEKNVNIGIHWIWDWKNRMEIINLYFQGLCYYTIIGGYFPGDTFYIRPY